MSRHRHPDTETLASLRTGLVDGFRGRRLAAHVARCARCAAVSDELGAVSSFLAAVPVPSLPERFERQITAALAAETATRATTARESADAAAGNGQPVLSPVGADRGGTAERDSADRVPPSSRRPSGARRRGRADRFRPAMAFVPVVACLLLAGFGYLLSNTGSSAGPSSPGPLAGQGYQPATTPSAAGAASSPLIHGLSTPAGNQARTPAASPGHFRVIASGTHYKATTLRAQVNAELEAVEANLTPTQSSGTTTPNFQTPNGNNGGGFFTPTTALTDCVLSLTNNVTPKFVDEASYQAQPVYVIALPDRVWVVGRGCTASDPELVVSVVLTAP